MTKSFPGVFVIECDFGYLFWIWGKYRQGMGFRTLYGETLVFLLTDLSKHQPAFCWEAQRILCPMRLLKAFPEFLMT